VINSVRGLGAELSYKFDNIDAISVQIDRARLPELSTVAGIKAVYKETVVDAPRPVQGNARKSLAADAETPAATEPLSEAQISSLATSSPSDFSFNNRLIGASALHAGGNQGAGIIVAVIDTGTTNAPVVADLTGTVIGGENFVPANVDAVRSATSRRNGPHGTWVGTVIAGHAAFLFSAATTAAIRRWSPESVQSNGAVPVIGVAPQAKIYAMKVFPSSNVGAPESRIIAAMDRAITLRRNFNNGVPSVPVSGTGTEDDPFVFNSLKIDVVNMSLGGPTLFAGRDVEDLLTLTMLQVGITIVVSAGNSGPAALTVSSPGSGIGSLTLGAATTPTSERILREVQLQGIFGPGAGAIFRPDDHTQTAFFSSRGPNADGRLDPEITANGFATFAQGSCNNGATPPSFSAACLAGTAQAGFAFVSGTSFSSPTAAGAAALLRKAFASATATQIRNALVAGADPAFLGDGSGKIDQGRGFLSVTGAAAALQSGRVSSSIPGAGHDDDHGDGDDDGDSVRENIAEAGFRTVEFENNSFSAHVANLKPGQAKQFFVRTRRDTDKLTVTLRNITPENAPANQNLLFGDDVIFHIVDAPTSFAATRVFDFFNSDQTFAIDNPQTGIVRVTLSGDWTNAGRVSADVGIVQHRTPLTPETAEGKVRQDDLIPVLVNIPAGTKVADFRLFWKHDWGAYPTNDIDLILQAPNGTLNFDGATFDSPERAVVQNPQAGVWTAYVNGFTVNGRRDEWELRATADGVRLRRR
jgi:subtilisin family serine protease